jgi:Mg2+ and Co2+ transporter CorA
MLINCAAYQDGRRIADPPIEDISDYLERPGCFVWVALRDASAEELDEMRREFNLHDLAVEDARKGHQRPKIEEYGDSLFVVMHLAKWRSSPARTTSSRCATAARSISWEYANAANANRICSARVPAS